MQYTQLKQLLKVKILINANIHQTTHILSAQIGTHMHTTGQCTSVQSVS